MKMLAKDMVWQKGRLLQFSDVRSSSPASVAEVKLSTAVMGECGKCGAKVKAVSLQG